MSCRWCHRASTPAAACSTRPPRPLSAQSDRNHPTRRHRFRERDRGSLSGRRRGRKGSSPCRVPARHLPGLSSEHAQAGISHARPAAPGLPRDTSADTLRQRLPPHRDSTTHRSTDDFSSAGESGVPSHHPPTAADARLALWSRGDGLGQPPPPVPTAPDESLCTAQRPYGCRPAPRPAQGSGLTSRDRVASGGQTLGANPSANRRSCLHPAGTRATT